MAYAVRCENLDMDDILHDFAGVRGSLPCRYLGLPLGFRKPKRIEVQPLIDKIASRLKNWKGRLLSRDGRLVLVNSVITSSATYFLTSFSASKWAVKRIDKLRRNFLWSGDDEAHGGKCMVNWQTICAPKKYSGLGIKNLDCFSRALRLRWPWFEWMPADRPWKGTTIPCDQSDMALFWVCCSIKIGNGKKAKFWTDRWLDGEAPGEFAPGLFKLARRKNLTVSQAMDKRKMDDGAAENKH